MDLNQGYINSKRKIVEIYKRNLASGGGVGVQTGSKTRVPPNQRLVPQMIAMPPISVEYPHIERGRWTLEVTGEVENPLRLNWDDFIKLGEEQYKIDFHCVTKWSKLDQNFTGIPFKKIVALSKPKSGIKHVIFEGADGYSTNISLAELLASNSFLAFKMDDHFIEDKFGGPVRGVIPHLYGWKSCKHLNKIRFQANDEPGFWEVRGYHNHADPWKEERYS